MAKKTKRPSAEELCWRVSDAMRELRHATNLELPTETAIALSNAEIAYRHAARAALDSIAKPAVVR